MIRATLLMTTGASAIAAVVTPVIIGLNTDPSFSQRLPVRVPAHASAPSFPDDPIASATSRREPEPGDDRGGRSHEAEPGDDSGGSGGGTEPGDDSGGHGGGEVGRHGGSDG